MAYLIVTIELYLGCCRQVFRARPRRRFWAGKPGLVYIFTFSAPCNIQCRAFCVSSTQTNTHTASNAEQSRNQHRINLQPRINLIQRPFTRKLAPRPAEIQYILRNRHARQSIRILQNIHIKSTGHMPGNMTMQRPDAIVIRINLQHQIPVLSIRIRSNHLHVPPHRISTIDD